MLITGQIGTTSALLLIGLFSLVLPEGTGRGFVILALTITFLAFQQGAIFTCHLADAFGDLPAQDARPGHGRIGVRVVALGVAAILFAVKCVPETKDKTLEDLEHVFKHQFKHQAGVATGAKVSAADLPHT